MINSRIWFIFLILFNLVIIIIYENIFNKPRVKLIKVNKTSIADTNCFKYILLWTNPYTVPFSSMGKGQTIFVEKKCAFTNCHVTSNINLLKNITMFDVIAFAGPQVVETRRKQWPKYRSVHQKYVFVSIESSHNYPACNPDFNNFFNWTWTYRLDSDARWGYIVVRDINGTIIGPKKDMKWIKHEDMSPTPDNLKDVLIEKTKLAAWYVSNCKKKTERWKYIEALQRVLKRYNKSIDIYGSCGKLKCPRDYEQWCNERIRRNYYFYMAFENSVSEDYVTEKVLKGLQYNAIPIVYGGANYSRFIPPESYINAYEMPVKKTAKIMLNLFSNFKKYVDYFRWTNHYTFHSTTDSAETDEYCSICEMLNDENKISQKTVYTNFTAWWTSPKVNCRKVMKRLKKKYRWKKI